MGLRRLQAVTVAALLMDPTVAFAGDPLKKVSGLLEDGKTSKAVDFCAKLLTQGKAEPQELREACGDAELRLLNEAGGASDRSALDGLAARWPRTRAGVAAHVASAELALQAAGEEPGALEALIVAYADTPSMAVAAARLESVQWRALVAAPSLAGLDAYAARWPTATAGRSPTCERLREVASLSEDVRDACANAALERLSAGPANEAELLAVATRWAGAPAAGQAFEDAAKLALAGASDDTALTRVRSAYPGTLAASEAATRLRVLRWEAVKSDGGSAALRLFIEEWPGSDEAAQAGARLADNLVDGAWRAANTAGGRTDGAQAASPWLDAPSVAVRALLEVAGPPHGGTWVDTATWSATWSAPSGTLSVRLSDLAVKIERGPAAASLEEPVPPELSAHMAALVTGAAWSVASTTQPASAWEFLGMISGRIAETTTSNVTSWLRMTDPILHATKVWSFNHRLGATKRWDGKVVTATRVPNATDSLQRLFAITTDGLGVLALNRCRVVPADCQGDDSAVQTDGCTGVVVAGTGGPPQGPVGLRAGVAIAANGDVGLDMSVSGVNGYCYDLEHRASWHAVRQDGARWVATPIVGPPPMSARSLAGAESMPPQVAFMPGKEEWCGDVTVYTPGLLKDRFTGAVLAKRAIAATRYGSVYVVEEALPGCSGTQSMIVDADGRNPVFLTREELEARLPTLRFFTAAARLTARDFPAGRRLAACRVGLGGKILMCGDPVSAMVDPSNTTLTALTEGLGVPVVPVGPSAHGLGLLGRTRGRWVFDGPSGLQMEDAVDGTTAMEIVGDGSTAVYLARANGATHVRAAHGASRRAVGTFAPDMVLQGQSKGASVKNMWVDADSATAWSSAALWASRVEGSQGVPAGSAAVVDVSREDARVQAVSSDLMRLVVNGAQTFRIGNRVVVAEPWDSARAPADAMTSARYGSAGGVTWHEVTFR